MFRIIPRDTSFFDMFAAMSNNLIDAARALVDLFADYRDVDAKIEEIRRIEHLGDEMTHSIMRKLNQTFITPFDREDIHTLASSLDDVVDFINAACARIVMYRITDPPPEAGTLARLILAQSEELGKAVSQPPEKRTAFSPVASKSTAWKTKPTRFRASPSRACSNRKPTPSR